MLTIRRYGLALAAFQLVLQFAAAGRCQIVIIGEQKAPREIVLQKGTPNYDRWTARLTPANVQDIFLRGNEIRMRAAVVAGSASLAPPDSPAARVDPNVATSPFAGVGSVKITDASATYLCTGTVIGTSHILTAAHCFDIDDNGVIDPGLTVEFNLNAGPTVAIPVTSMTVHPSWIGFLPGSGHDDLAVAKLGSPVASSLVYALAPPSPFAAGDEIIIAGYGQTGAGDVGYTPPPPDFVTKRSGRNETDSFVLDDEGGSAQEVFIYDFDGVDASGNPLGISGGPTLGNTIETTIGGGDSGGPAFVDIGGTLHLAGVNTFTLNLPPITPDAPFFGSLGGGIDVSNYQSWIQSVVPEPASSGWLLGAVTIFGTRQGRRRRP